MAKCQLHRVGTIGLGSSSSSSGPPRRTASSRGFATLTRQMGELNVHTTNIDESLG